MDDLNILIKAKISTLPSEIDAQINSLNAKIKSVISVKLNVDASSIDVITKKINEKIKTQTNMKSSQFINTTVENQAFNQISSRIREIRKNVDELAKVNINTNSKGQMTSATLTYYNQELGQTIKETMGWSEAQKKVNGELTKIKTFGTTGFNYSDDMAKTNSNIQKNLDKLQLYENKITKLKAGFTSPATGITDSINLSNLNTQYDKILSTINQVRNGSINLSNEQRRGIIQNISNLEIEIARYKDLQRITATTNTRSLSTNDISLYQANMANRLASLQVGKETVFARPEIQAEMNNLISAVAKFGTVGGKSAKELNLQFAQLTTSVRAATNEITRINGAADSFLTTLSKNFVKMIAWAAVATALYAPLRSLQAGLVTLKELDSLMVNIAKVTNLSAEAMDNLKNSAFEAANAFGRTAQDYLKSIGEFSRAGYEGKAEDLAKVSLLSQNVGELTAEQANGFLLATDAAYKYKGSQEELMKVLDGANIIDNKYATSISKISEGITVAGSIASNASVGVNELSAAIGVMTAVTQRSGNEAGRAFRGILMNIRQIKGETEDGEIIDDEALSKSAAALNSVGIKVHEMRNGIEELRNPMDVLQNLSDIWGSLSSMQTAPIIEALGGKYRGNEQILLTASSVQKCA